MKKLLAVLAVLSLAGPAQATPETRKVIAYDEMMVLVPGLEYLGYSRISTVEFCSKANKVNDWTSLITDHDFDVMEGCLIEMT
jgi:hypothetical protein